MSTPSDACAHRGPPERRTHGGRRPVQVRLSAERGGISHARARRKRHVALCRRCAVQRAAAARSRDVLLSLAPDGAETLFVAEPVFVRALKARAPALSARASAGRR